MEVKKKKDLQEIIVKLFDLKFVENHAMSYIWDYIFPFGKFQDLFLYN